MYLNISTQCTIASCCFANKHKPRSSAFAMLALGTRAIEVQVVPQSLSEPHIAHRNANGGSPCGSKISMYWNFLSTKGRRLGNCKHRAEVSDKTSCRREPESIDDHIGLLGRAGNEEGFGSRSTRTSPANEFNGDTQIVCKLTHSQVYLARLVQIRDWLRQGVS
jgi:hypothetical protein